MGKFRTVYKGDNVTFRQLNDGTWLGTGNVMSNESLYLIEGKGRAILIDAGTTIPGLDKIVAGITDKPVTLVLTHVHPDHAGAVDNFSEVWINPADTVNVPAFMPNYQGKINYLRNGHKIELGDNFVDLARLKKIEEIAKELKEGKLQGEAAEGVLGINRRVSKDNFRLYYIEE